MFTKKLITTRISQNETLLVGVLSEVLIRKNKYKTGTMEREIKTHANCTVLNVVLPLVRVKVHCLSTRYIVNKPSQRVLVEKYHFKKSIISAADNEAN